MTRSRIVIVDYQLSNLFSVLHACEFLRLNANISSEKEDIIRAQGLVLPGVGAFGQAMERLHQLDLVLPIKEFVASGRPLFGVCLGLQLLFEESEEFGHSRGLGLLSGCVRRFPGKATNSERAKVPQIGWNRVWKPPSTEWSETPFCEIKDGSYFYFVHSYFASRVNGDTVLGVTDYAGLRYCSAVQKQPNIFATQFHPEKSGPAGLSVYRAWAKMYRLDDDE